MTASMRESGQEGGARPADPALVASDEVRSGLHPAGFDPSRVLFLDMDGVVLSGQDLWRTHNNRFMPAEKIALIRQVCERAGAVVVVSSTWRYSDDTGPALECVGIPLHRDWRTDWRNDYVGSIIQGQRRGVEIMRWLAKHPETTSYAIVDDDSDMLPEQLPRFVQTPFQTGIEQRHVDRLVAILAQGIEAGTDETRNEVRPEGQEPGPKDAP